jgi:hypothetical protein
MDLDFLEISHNSMVGEAATNSRAGFWSWPYLTVVACLYQARDWAKLPGLVAATGGTAGTLAGEQGRRGRDGTGSQHFSVDGLRAIDQSFHVPAVSRTPCRSSLSTDYVQISAIAIGTRHTEQLKQRSIG